MNPHSLFLLASFLSLLLLIAFLAGLARYRTLQRTVARLRKEKESFLHRHDELLYLSDGYEEVYAGMQYRLRSILIEMKALAQIMKQHYHVSPLGFDSEYFSLLERSIAECQKILDDARHDGDYLIKEFSSDHHLALLDLVAYMQKHASRMRRHKTGIQVIVDVLPSPKAHLHVLVDKYFLDKVMHNLTGHILQSVSERQTVHITLTDKEPEELVEVKLAVLGAKPARNGKGKRLFSSDNESELYAAHYYIMALCGKVYYSENSDKELAFFFELPKAPGSEKIKMMTALASF
jgi:hypothetical protein